MKNLAVYLATILCLNIYAFADTAKTTADKKPGDKKMSDTYVLFDTSLGKFKGRLFTDKAPITTQNFIDLAEGKSTNPGLDPKYKGKKYFDGLVFHRVIPKFMIQGGDPIGNGTGGPGYTIADEFHPELKHNKKGLFSMANRGPNTGGSQFFVTVAETPWLDGKHAIFGEVVEGYDVVEKISNAPRDGMDRPNTPVKINSVVIERK